MSSIQKKRIAVAMSGGVDSSVAAALLTKQGYDVFGVTMNLWDASEDFSNTSCCSAAGAEDARRVCSRMGISHYVMCFRKEFNEDVVQKFAEEYSIGRTPNPCIECNRHLKFGHFLRKVMALGADAMATGHYAQVRLNKETGRWELLRGLDPGKDQSYALYCLTQEQLAHTVFPLGEIEKTETRELAEEFGLVTAKKPESQEICFVPDKNYVGFLQKYRPGTQQPGEIVDMQGHVVGHHSGIAGYTIGQRRRIGVTAPTPLYVVDIQPESNRLVVGSNQDLEVKNFLVTNLNWISLGKLDHDLEATIKIRYNMKDVAGVLVPQDNGDVMVQFENPQRAVTPGQAAVFYQGECVLGGGTIVHSL